MKTSNIQTTHNQAIIRGWVDSVALTSGGGSSGGGTIVGQYENASGFDLTSGAVVVLNSAGAIELTSTAQDTRPVGVVVDTIADGDFGPVAWQGPVPVIAVSAAVTAGCYAETSTAPGAATDNVARRTGSFGYFTSAGTSPTAFLFGGGGGSGVTTTMWFNVRDYGALGDGSTDDLTAFNDAIAALIAFGAGVLYVPASPTAYVISAGLDTITVPCTVMGDGWAYSGPGSTIACTSQTAVLFTTSADGVQFRNLNLTNTYAGTASAGAAIVATNATLNEYESVLIQDFYTGIDIEDSVVWKMRACHILNVHKYGVRIRNTAVPDAGDWFISDSWFGTTAAADAGIRIESSGGGKIVNCKINGDTGTSNFAYGIDLALITSAATAILLITNTSIENVSSGGIRGTTSAATSTYGNIEIGNCQFSILGNTGKAISLVATTASDFYNVVIHGCEFGTAGTARSAIQLTKCDNVILTALALYANFTSYFTNTTSTNVRDYTGGVAAGVSITGTPSAGQVPVASSGTAAAWGSAAIAEFAGTGAAVATSETTTSTTYADLTTPGPSATVTIGASGKAYVTVGGQFHNNTANKYTGMGVVISGASTVAVATWLLGNSGASSFQAFGRRRLLTGLSAGSTTFKVQYIVEAGTGTFVNREIIVEPVI